MNKTMKKIAVVAAVVTLSTGALFAQPKPVVNDSHHPVEKENPAPKGFDQRPGKLLGVIEEVTSNTITFIDMDGKKVTVYTTPFTDIQDIEKLDRVDPKAKDSKEQLRRTYLYMNQLNKGHWVDISAYKTEGGKLVAEYVKVIRFPAGGSVK